MAREQLTERQRRFVELYMGECAGNGTEAARRAGYRGDDAVLHVTAHRLLRNAKVQRAITERVEACPEVKGREAIQRFLSRAIDNTALHIRDRLRASELLARSLGMFVFRLEHTGADGAPLVTAQMHFYLPDNGRRPPPAPAEPSGSPSDGEQRDG